MTSEDLRRLALALPETEEKSHFDKADFRVRNKIFASLKDEATGVIKLTPEEQSVMAEAEPEVFQALPGGWGHKGWTKVILPRQMKLPFEVPRKPLGAMLRLVP